jgi:5-methylcytosine-specific restriction endonuclease McrA
VDLVDPAGAVGNRRLTLRAALTLFLIAAAALLSFGALRHRALEAGIIHGDLLWGHLSAHTLAGIWALVLKVLAAVGILGIRESKGRDPRAWVALGLGLGLDLWFQTYGYGSWIARGQAAVPPLALALAVWIFEVPQARPDWAIPTPLGDPVPSVPDPEPEPEPEPDLEELERLQAELDAKVEAELVRLEEQWERTRLRKQVNRARDRAVELGAPIIDFTREDWLSLLEEHQHRCAYCDASDLALLIEHRTPLSRGGGHTRSNIVPACEPCNLNKADRTEEEWEAHRATQSKAERTAQAAQRVRHRENPPRRRRAAQGATQRIAPAAQREEVTRRAAQGDSALSIAKDLGLSDRARKGWVAALVREHRPTPAHRNGDGP